MLHLRMTPIIAAAFIAFILSPPTFAYQTALSIDLASLSIDPASSSVNVGNSAVLDVNISNITNLYAFQFDLSFAPGTLSAVSIVEGSFLPTVGATFFVPGTIDNVGGTIASTADTLLGPRPGVNGSGTLAILTLTGLAPGTSSIGLSNVTLLNSSLGPISAGLQNGNVRVAGMAPTPELNSLGLFITGISVLAAALLLRTRSLRTVLG
jgi:hypothetical protein